jgi:hypothetical protein
VYRNSYFVVVTMFVGTWQERSAHVHFLCPCVVVNWSALGGKRSKLNLTVKKACNSFREKRNLNTKEGYVAHSRWKLIDNAVNADFDE